MNADNCTHMIISTFEPTATEDGWDFTIWKGVCSQCGLVGTHDQNTGVFTPDPNANLIADVEEAMDAGAYKRFPFSTARYGRRRPFLLRLRRAGLMGSR